MKKKRVERALRFAAVVAVLSTPIGAAAQCQLQKLTGSTSAAGDNFGRRVAMSGDLLAVAAPLHAGAGAQSGSVYVYRLEAGAWVQEQEIIPGDAAAGDQFGFWISMDAGRLLIGAKFDDDLGTDAGSAYVFRRDGTTWVQEQKLLPLDGLAGDNFGNSVSLSGDVALIGSPTHDGTVTDSGAAYIFRRGPLGWAQEQMLLANNPIAGDQAGFTVALDGSRALLGAWMADTTTGTLDVGSAYVFRHDGSIWSQEAHLTPSDGAAADRFAVGLTLVGDLAVVGADLADPNGLASAGAAYIYRRSGNTWTEEQKLTAFDGLAGDQFGFSVATDGPTLLTSAINADLTTSVLNTGAVYVYRHSGGTWTLRGRFSGTDSASLDLFGSHLAFSGSRAVVGARQDDDLGTDSGSTYVFSWPTCVCYADCNADNALTIADFGCFQSRFASQNSYADCNQSASLTIADFGCFQSQFASGCQ